MCILQIIQSHLPILNLRCEQTDNFFFHFLKSCLRLRLSGMFFPLYSCLFWGRGAVNEMKLLLIVKKLGRLPVNHGA